jgi:hypothetical protein
VKLIVEQAGPEAIPYLVNTETHTARLEGLSSSSFPSPVGVSHITSNVPLHDGKATSLRHLSSGSNSQDWNSLSSPWEEIKSIGVSNVDIRKLDTVSEIPEHHIEDNPFAYIPEQLVKLHDPKNLNVLRAMGGVFGLVFGLRTDIKKGLSPDETLLEGRLTMSDVVRHAVETRGNNSNSKIRMDDPNGLESAQKLSRSATSRRSQTRRRSALSLVAKTISIKPPPPANIFEDRRRIFSSNIIPVRKPKNIFQLMWLALQDRILVRTSFKHLLFALDHPERRCCRLAWFGFLPKLSTWRNK